MKHAVFSNESSPTNQHSPNRLPRSQNSMADNSKMWRTLGVLLILFAACHAKEKAKPIVLNEDNWTDMLEGEWMVKL